MDGDMGDLGDLGSDLGSLDAEPGTGSDDVIDGEVLDDGDQPGDQGEDVVDADFVDVLPDGTVLSTETGVAIAYPDVTVTAIDGIPVSPTPPSDDLEDPHGSDGARPSGGGTYADGSQHGTPKFPGAGGGGGKSGPGAWWRKKKDPKSAGAKFGGGSGGGGGSLVGSLITISVSPTANVGNGASVASPNIAPAVGGIAATGNPPTGRSGSSRRPSSSGRRRPSRGGRPFPGSGPGIPI